MAREILLTGRSGRRYRFELVSVNGIWNAVPGLYVFIGPMGRVVYIGETKSFASRQPGPGHEKWTEALQHGPISIAAHVNRLGEDVRKAEELDLIQAYNPPCNVQNKLAAAFRQTRRY